MPECSDLRNLVDDRICQDEEDKRIRFGGLYDIGQGN